MTRSPVPVLFSLAVLFVSGCEPYKPSFTGSPVWSMFPFDGQRTWTYLSTDESLAYKLVGTSSGEPEVKAGTNVYTVVYSTTCFGNDPDCEEGEVVRKVKWSSDQVEGVFVHAYSVGEQPFVDLEPPIQVTTDDMKRGESLSTTTGGGTWTSTMDAITECPIVFSAAWDECGQFTLAVDSGDGAPIAGTYWATVGNGTAAFELAGDSGQWQLSDTDCQPAEDCDGSW